MLKEKFEEEYISKTELLSPDFIKVDIEQFSLSSKLQVK
jgi:hypothetical protein